MPKYPNPKIKIIVVCQHNQARSQLLSLYLKKYLLGYSGRYEVDSAGVELATTRRANLKLIAIQVGQRNIAERMELAQKNDPTLYGILRKQYDPEKLKMQTGGLHEIDEITSAVTKQLTAKMISESNLVICVSKDMWEAVQDKFGNRRNVVTLPSLLRFGPHEVEIGGQFGLKVSMYEHWKATHRIRRVAKLLARVLHERFSS